MDKIPKRCPECKIMPEIIEQLEEDLIDIVTDKQYIGLSVEGGRQLRVRLLDELRTFFKELVR